LLTKNNAIINFNVAPRHHRFLSTLRERSSILG
jgi:hypothetical protein